MRRKNSSVILKEGFKNQEEIFQIYSVFKKKLKSFIKKKLLVAVSGGPDSLALTALLKAVSYEKKCKIYYVLVDHNLRKNSAKEAQSVKKLLKKYQINLYILKNQKKINIILTAHNLEDQVETFFIRLSRGSGLDGLS